LTAQQTTQDLWYIGTFIFTIAFLSVTVKIGLDTSHWTWVT
jgi:hypothetical protein